MGFFPQDLSDGRQSGAADSVELLIHSKTYLECFINVSSKRAFMCNLHVLPMSACGLG